MGAMKPIPDPYRVLGVQRGADADEVKAAHRRLAKRYHPDGGSGDEQRFLVVQDAYQLLSDPVLRREWDRRHSARPMDAHDRAGRAPTRAASTRWTREDANTYRRRPMSRRERRRADARAEGSGRDPRTRRHTWSAEGVPWWEDFSPKRGRATDEPEAPTKPQERARGDPVESAADGSATVDQGAVPDFDVYNRSSGAAWSMAARRHFRRDDADLPSRGAFRYRGTQVVTGSGSAQGRRRGGRGRRRCPGGRAPAACQRGGALPSQCPGHSFAATCHGVRCHATKRHGAPGRATISRDPPGRRALIQSFCGGLRPRTPR